MIDLNKTNTTSQCSSDAEYAEKYPIISSELITRHFEHAKEFLEYMIERYSRFDADWPVNAGNSYLFRGQKQSFWTILPTALRQSFMCIDIVDYQLIKTPCKTVQEARNIYYVFHEMLENRVLAKFVTDCLGEGIGFPHDQQNELALLAARSYGLPTRLIDFSLNPVVASFFAAFEVDAECAQNNLGRAVVWAIPRLIFAGALANDVFRDFQNWKEASTAFAYGYSEHMRRQKAIVVHNNNVRLNLKKQACS